MAMQTKNKIKQNEEEEKHHMTSIQSSEKITQINLMSIVYKSFYTCAAANMQTQKNITENNKKIRKIKIKMGKGKNMKGNPLKLTWELLFEHVSFSISS